MKASPNKQIFTLAIKAYLDGQAATDSAFAVKYANPEKSLDECIKYIFGEVYNTQKPERKNNVAACAVSREEIYGMALHYYDEETVKVRAIAGLKMADTASVGKVDDKKKENKAEAKPVQKPVQRKPAPRKPSVDEEFGYGLLFEGV